MIPNKESCSEFSVWWQAQTGSSHVTSRAIGIFVDKRLSQWNLPLPVDPSIFAQQLGCSVRIEDVPAGRLEVSSTQLRIRLPRHQSTEKQRFSAAHELAHLLLLERDDRGVRHPFQIVTGNVSVNREQYLRRARVEWLCDYIARVILVPPKYLRERFSIQTCFTFSTLSELAKEFDVPISVVFERLAEDGYIPKHPGHVLLRYGVNEVTRREPKWRVAARSVPGVEFAKRFPIRNQSLDGLGIQFPPPNDMAMSRSTREFSFTIQASNWILRMQHFEPPPSPLLLVSIELMRESERCQTIGAQKCRSVPGTAALLADKAGQIGQLHCTGRPAGVVGQTTATAVTSNSGEWSLERIPTHTSVLM